MTGICQREALRVGHPVFHHGLSPSFGGVPLHSHIVSLQEGKGVSLDKEIGDFQLAFGGLAKGVLRFIYVLKGKITKGEILISEGKVRIEPCGPNLCGYSVNAKSNQNGEQVLINMKPGKDSKWSGRILDPNSGSTYDSTIALKGSDSLRVQGCAFGGMFCGGQTWSRLN